jgi:hypothetical protein
MASENQPSDVTKDLWELIGDSEVNFFTDSAVDSSMLPEAEWTKFFEGSAKRLRESRAEAWKIYQDYLSIGTPFGLFLRAFESEAYRYDLSDDISRHELFRLKAPQSVERHLHATVHQRIPFIAIVSPVDLLVRGLIPRFGGTKDWEHEVNRLARQAAIIVFHCYALGPGVSTELNLLRRCQREDSTVIILRDVDSPEDIPPPVPARHEVPRKNHPALVGFSRVAYEREIDWGRPETSPFFGNLLRAALRQKPGDPTRLPNVKWLPPEYKLLVLQERARALRLKGYFEDAAVAAADALAIAKQLGDLENIAAAHISVGIVALEMGRLDEAQKEFRESVKMLHKLGNKDGEAAAAAWAGRAYKKAGQAESAVHFFLIALQRSWELNATNDMVDTLRQMAPLLDKISPATRQDPGVQLAAKLIVRLDPNPSRLRDSIQGNRRASRWPRRGNG